MTYRSWFRLASMLLAAGFCTGLANAAEIPPAAASAAKVVPLKDFAEFSQFKIVRISPQGEYLAATFDEGDQDDLVTIDLANKKIMTRQQIGKDFRIDNLWWVSQKRIVYALAEQQGGSLIRPALTGELLGVDADGRNFKYLFGYRAPESVEQGHIKGAERAYGYARMINPLPEDPAIALISVEDARDGDRYGRLQVARLNVNTGAVNNIDTAPVTGFAAFLADDDGHPRFALGTDDRTNPVAFVKRGDEWQQLNAGSAKGAQIEPEVLSADGKRAYLRSNEGSDRLCLVEQDLATGERKSRYCDPVGDVGAILMSFDRQEAIGVSTDTGSTGTQFFNTSNPDTEKLRKLFRSFPGQYVEPVSATRDGSRIVILVAGDHNPGDYYLFSSKTLKAEYLASRRSAIDPDQMSDRRAIDMKARDGQTIHAVLTVPAKRGTTNLPLIVNPHGGPFDVHDNWFWDETPEMLASRGYAVLQVNFRGSGGYGQAYRDAGKHGWDGIMINDITDATRSVVSQGIADPSRICIFGASYGGYAAVMSAVKEPDLYKCTVGYAGVYDLVKLRSDTDSNNTERGRNFFEDYTGDTTERLKAASPLTYIDKLKAAIMIVHGTADERVPINQAKALRKALDARNYPYEWLIKDEEGHGFYKPGNRVELYTKMLAFFEKNIGPGAPVIEAPTETAKPASQ